MVEHVGRPWTCGVDQRLCGNRIALAALRLHGEPPHRALALGDDAADAWPDLGAAGAGVDRVEDNEAGIVHSAVRILEARRAIRLERGAQPVAAERDGASAAERATAGKPVIGERDRAEPRAGDPAAAMREQEAHRAD